MMPSYLRGRVLLRVGLAMATVALVSVSVKAVSAYRFEAKQFSGNTHRIPKPADADALGLADVTLRGAGGTEVRGWYVPPKNGAAVLFVHGSPADRTELLAEARALLNVGYGALLIDVPGHGESTGEATWGQPAQAAFRAGVDFLAAQLTVEKIAAFGFSMGSSVVAQGAAHDQRVSAVVLSGAFTTIEEQMSSEFGRWFSVWQAVTVIPALWAAREEGLDMKSLHSIDLVASIAPRPLLIIGGADDVTVPVAMTRALHAAAHEPKQLLIVPGAGHGHYERGMGEAYYATLRTFFEGALRTSANAQSRR